MIKRTLLALILALIAVPALAQTTLNGTYNLGRHYDIPQREFTLFHIPGLELELPPATGVKFKATMWFDAFDGEKVRTDLFVFQSVRLNNRWSLASTFGNINYFRPFTDLHKERRVDWVATVEVKYRIKTW